MWKYIAIRDALILKGQFTQKSKFCHHLLTVISLETRMSTKEVSLKNVGTVNGSI